MVNFKKKIYIFSILSMTICVFLISILIKENSDFKNISRSKENNIHNKEDINTVDIKTSNTKITEKKSIPNNENKDNDKLKDIVKRDTENDDLSKSIQIKGYIALIIDDLGNNAAGTKEIINMGIPITAAVMPYLSCSEKDADLAHNAGLEVIMHLPMEPIHGNPQWLGPRGITCNLTDDEIKLRVNDGLKQIKWAIGINNHMGSKATQDNRVMNTVMGIVKEKKLFFLDSLTSQNSIVASKGKEFGVQTFSRDIFIDNIKEKEYVKKQLEYLGNVALKRGYAVGIGHVGVEGGLVTAEAIKEIYPILEKRGIKFIYVSQLKNVCKK